MTQTVKDLMTPNPVTVAADSPVVDAARLMRDEHIGDVIVQQDGQVCGVVTDRDIVVRTIAEGRDPAATSVGDICSREITTVAPDIAGDDAVRLMREKAIRRLPVLDGDRPVGIVSIGDLAVERDERSALRDISAAPPNR